MKRYDPEQAPKPEEWLALDEQVRIELADAYHRRARIRLPNRKAHAIFHAIVENQIAEGIDPVVRAMVRLAAQGLARHEAVHAVASVLARHIDELFKAEATSSDSRATYYAALEGLTARSWRDG